MRESRSRPSWSVPSGYARDGGSLSRLKLVLVYGRGARKSAKIAIRHSRTTTTPPATARRLRRSRRTPSRHKLDDRGALAAAAFEYGLCPSRGEASEGRSAPPSLISDAGVEDPIEKIYNE